MMNKEYRLSSWPELSQAHHRTAYRRMLSEMSQRHMSLAQLVESSGLRRLEVKEFLETLESSGTLIARDACDQALKLSRFNPLRALGSWLRRSPVAVTQRR